MGLLKEGDLMQFFVQLGGPSADVARLVWAGVFHVATALIGARMAPIARLQCTRVDGHEAELESEEDKKKLGDHCSER